MISMQKLKIRTALFAFLALYFTACNSQEKADFSNNNTPQSEQESKEHSNEDRLKASSLSIGRILTENAHLSIKKRIALYYQLKKEHPESPNIKNEGTLNMYGYTLLWNDKTNEAIEIFKLVVSEFPQSSNSYDSLGEAYLKSGDQEKAIANYEKSIALDPGNFNATDQLDRIKYPYKLPALAFDKFGMIFTPREYKEDLDQLGKELTTVNPNALKFISKEAFWQLIEEKKASITEGTTYSEFVWHCSEIIASINCSHTSMGRFDTESEMLPVALRFPLQTRWIDNQLFVIDRTNNEDKVKIKDEILSINGIAVADLIKDIYKHISSQGFIETSKRHDFNTWATGMIPYALNFPKTYEIIIRGKEEPVTLNVAQAVNNQFDDPSIYLCRDGLCFNVLVDDHKTAVLTISTFNYYWWNNITVFEDFMDHHFKEISEQGIENLIIDLRFNGGGSPESSIYLLRYLMDQSFTYFSNTTYSEGSGVHHPFDNAFQGKLYFIIDGNGSSTTGHFMSMVKKFKLGTIIGEELGSNQFCTGGQKPCRLSHTKLNFFVANSTSESTATSLPDERGILPDHYIKQNIDDYLNSIDVVKRYTLELIRE